jgi:hypothetical protein
MAKGKHKKKKTYPVVIVGERATPERRKQLGGVVSEIVEVEEPRSLKTKVKRDRANYVSTLAYYHGTKRLNDPQTVAGEKYAELFNRVTFGYHYKVLCNPFLIDPGQADPEARMVAHMDCIRQLREIDALLSPAQRRVIINVCGYGERAKDKDERQTLQRGLDIAAEHWGHIRKKEK